MTQAVYFALFVLFPVSIESVITASSAAIRVGKELIQTILS